MRPKPGNQHGNPRYKNLIDLAGAAIAATAIINGAQLLTLNEKHFRAIPNLKLL